MTSCAVKKIKSLSMAKQGWIGLAEMVQILVYDCLMQPFGICYGLPALCGSVRSEDGDVDAGKAP